MSKHRAKITLKEWTISILGKMIIALMTYQGHLLVKQGRQKR